ncbi:dioxygenase family protein [Ramlibacter humi]|uniref:Intradiol ring-cleavage dioxygenase n=1 Tax=Ramlibacter humi TaxID=2530451 RepID=A0A4Z0BHJ9_9BURK|nr:protocatechuate 3,4-dioxygenase [Ramlibacter humi]TFY97594.1 intradiol ring-cleavage dioxygenase [Ramlibacter humi]
MHHPALLSRRAATAALVFAPSLLLAQTRRPTPAQTEGPFYPVKLPADTDSDLLQNGALHYAKGQPAWVDGVVTDLQGRPLAGSVVEIWQCDQAGHYNHPGDGGRADPAFQGFGRVTVGADGRYRFHTIRPVPYTGRTPHIHLKVKQGGRELLTTQMYVEGDPHNERDFLWRNLAEADRRAVTVPFRPGADGLQASFPIAIDA